MENTWRRSAGFWGPEERAKVATMNMASIAYMRAWAEKALNTTSILSIERVDGRNRVSVRFVLDGRETREVEVATLDALRKRRLKGPLLEQLLLEAIGHEGAG